MDGTTASGGYSTNRVEAERLLGISEKLLRNRDLSGAREFAFLAQETEPLLEGSDQILAITDVLIAAGKRINNNLPDWYSILQIERRSGDSDLIRKNYRRLALLLHPDKNRFPLADTAFQFVADAWVILSDPIKKSNYDSDLTIFTKVDLPLKSASQPQFHYQQNKIPVRRSPRAPSVSEASPSPAVQSGSTIAAATNRVNHRTSAFWTACPYCYVLYEYPKTYEDCCLRCQSCERGFHAAVLPSLPARVPGKEAYYCCWGFFPLGFKIGDSETGAKSNDHGNYNDNNNNDNNNNNPASAFPNWMPPIYSSTPVCSGMPPTSGAQSVRVAAATAGTPTMQAAATAGVATMQANSARKRGRPRKNPLS